MANILSDEKKQQVIALGRLGWTLRRIEAATGVRRETAGAYLKAAGLAVRPPGRWGHPPAKPAIEVSTDSANPASAVSTDFGVGSAHPVELPPWPPSTGRAPTASACEPYRELIELALGRGRNAKAIWQDLVDQHGFAARYASVRRFVITMRGQRTPYTPGRPGASTTSTRASRNGNSAFISSLASSSTITYDKSHSFSWRSHSALDN